MNSGVRLVIYSKKCFSCLWVISSFACLALEMPKAKGLINFESRWEMTHGASFLRGGGVSVNTGKVRRKET